MTLRNQAVLPAISLFGDNFWRGRKETEIDIKDLERRCIAQRDHIFNDMPYPFHFVEQTQLHWRITLEDGTVTVRDRDTMEQIRIPMSEVESYIESRIQF